MLAVMAREIRLLPRRPALAGLVIVLPLIMLLVLGGIFRAGIPTGMAVAVIDLDRSDLSRAVTRMLDAAPELTVTHRASDLSEARALIVSGAVRGAVLMPPNLERDITRGARPEIVTFYDNQHMSAGSLVARGARNAIDTALAGLRLSVRQGQGEAPVQAMVALQPIPMQAHALFNPAFDYVHFLLAALIPTVLQIIAAAATAYAVSLDFGPKGTICNAAEPAPHMNCTTTPMETLTDAVRLAFEKAMPSKVAASRRLVRFAVRWRSCCPHRSTGLAFLANLAA